MLPIITTKEALDLNTLSRTALQYIYEPEKMSASEIRMMEQSVVNWKQKIDLDHDLMRVNEQEEYLLQRIGYILKRNEEGGFNERKAFFKQHNINWRKYHRFPEAYNIADRIKALEELEKWNRNNPELAA
jgi:hypothetical protein